MSSLSSGTLSFKSELHKGNKRSEGDTIKENCGSKGLRPESQVVSQQLHDQGGVLVALLTESVQLSNRIIKCLLSELASFVRSIENLIVEHAEVERESKTDGVSGGKLDSSNGRGSLVGFKRSIRGHSTLVTRCELGEIAVVVSLPVRSIGQAGSAGR